MSMNFYDGACWFIKFGKTMSCQKYFLSTDHSKNIFHFLMTHMISVDFWSATGENISLEILIKSLNVGHPNEITPSSPTFPWSKRKKRPILWMTESSSSPWWFYLSRGTLAEALFFFGFYWNHCKKKLEYP